MRVSLIVAVAANHVIGHRGELPWHLPEDLKRFKALTMGKPIVMGRLTHESIGRPLPGRRNIVISRQPGYNAAGCVVVRSPGEALQAAAGAEEIMVIGGGRIYRQMLPQCDRIYLTRVHANPEGDAFFELPDPQEWRRTHFEDFPAGPHRPLGFSYETLERVAAAGSVTP